MDLEENIINLQQIYESQMPAELVSILAMKSDGIDLPPPTKTVIQTINEEAFNFDPFLFIQATIPEASSIGPSTVSTVFFNLAVVFAAGNLALEWKKSFRYANALLNLAHRNFDNQILSGTIKVNQHAPDGFQDDTGYHLVSGITISMKLFE